MGVSLKTIYEIEKEMILERIEQFEYLSQAADSLGIKLITLIDRLLLYGIYDQYKHKGCI